MNTADDVAPRMAYESTVEPCSDESADEGAQTADEGAQAADGPRRKRCRLSAVSEPPPAHPQPARTQRPQPGARETRALRSVLKVFCTKVSPRFSQPWKMNSETASTGSAFVISSSEKLILTNAHVVRYHTSVRVRRPGDARKYKARLVCFGRDCDLALLSVDDPAFWVAPFMDLSFSPEPQLQDPTFVVGYPTGGDQLSITKGIVSRVTMARYPGICSLLAIQIDAAINPGNSGGPTFSDLAGGEVVGVAFSHMRTASNVGYIIPRSVIQHFLDEYHQHGAFRGVPIPGCETQRLENDGIRAWLGLPAGRSGVMVRKLAPLSRCSDVLRERDVLLRWNGVDVANDGTIELPGRPDERVSWTHLAVSAHLGDTAEVEVWRQGRVVTVSLLMEGCAQLVPSVEGADCEPTYFIVAGLVFVPLSHPFARDAFSSKHPTPAPLVNRMMDYPEREGQQVIVLHRILSGDVNYGYAFQNTILSRVNGRCVLNIRELADEVDAALAGLGEGEEGGAFLEFETERGTLLVLDARKAREATALILAQHNIPSDRSSNLLGGGGQGDGGGGEANGASGVGKGAAE